MRMKFIWEQGGSQMITKDSRADGAPSPQVSRQHISRHEKLKEDQYGRAGGEEAVWMSLEMQYPEFGVSSSKF